MKAADLLEKATLWLRAQYPEAHIIPEFSVAEYGGALVDVAAVLPDRIVGIEIKGEGDSPARLGLQGMMYSRVCREMFLLASPCIQDRCMKARPPGWGSLLTSRDDRHPTLLCEASGLYSFKYRAHDKIGRGLAPGAIAAIPWTKEYRLFGECLRVGLPRQKDDCIEQVVQRVPLRDIEKAVCEVIRRRDWMDKAVDYPDVEAPAKATGSLL